MPTDEELMSWDNYMLQASKAVKTVDGRNYRVSVNLQIFIDKEGKFRWVCER